MKCDKCGRDNLSVQELAIHNKYFHGKVAQNQVVNGTCPDCGAMMQHEEGCTVCRACGYSKCG